MRDGFYFEEDTLEEVPLDEVVEGVNRELDLMKSFPVYQAFPRAEVTGKVWPTRWCYRTGTKTSESAFSGETVRKLPQSHSWARGHESVVSDGSTRPCLRAIRRACLTLTVFTNSDWAGDRPTRKSVSSCVIMLDGFLISAGARTQSVISQSSCEADRGHRSHE